MKKYETEVIAIPNHSNIDENINEYEAIRIAASKLRNGEVVAFPTETVYGLGGNALQDDAISKIYEAKGRPSDNPLIVHISKEEQLASYVTTIPEHAQKLMKAFWPGPLTIVLYHKGNLSSKVTANLPTVAVRMPNHPIALSLIDEANVPLAAPSANTSGKPSPTKAMHVYQDLQGKIPMIIDGGATGVGLESTVVDCTTEKVTILRPGGVTKEELEEVVGEVAVDPALSQSNLSPKSPGVKYTHYAPAVPLILLDGSKAFIHFIIEEERKKGNKVGMVVTEENKGVFPLHKEIILGKRNDLKAVAQNLYEALRQFQKDEVDIIFAEVYPETELGSAIMNRLKKAASGKIISEYESSPEQN